MRRQTIEDTYVGVKAKVYNATRFARKRAEKRPASLERDQVFVRQHFERLGCTANGMVPHARLTYILEVGETPLKVNNPEAKQETGCM